MFRKACWDLKYPETLALRYLDTHPILGKKQPVGAAFSSFTRLQTSASTATFPPRDEAIPFRRPAEQRQRRF